MCIVRGKFSKSIYTYSDPVHLYLYLFYTITCQLPVEIKNLIYNTINSNTFYKKAYTSSDPVYLHFHLHHYREKEFSKNLIELCKIVNKISKSTYTCTYTYTVTKQKELFWSCTLMLIFYLYCQKGKANSKKFK